MPERITATHAKMETHKSVEHTTWLNDGKTIGLLATIATLTLLLVAALGGLCMLYACRKKPLQTSGDTLEKLEKPPDDETSCEDGCEHSKNTGSTAVCNKATRQQESQEQLGPPLAENVVKSKPKQADGGLGERRSGSFSPYSIVCTKAGLANGNANGESSPLLLQTAEGAPNGRPGRLSHISSALKHHRQSTAAGADRSTRAESLSMDYMLYSEVKKPKKSEPEHPSNQLSGELWLM